MQHQNLYKSALTSIEAVDKIEALEEIRVTLFGKKGQITELMKSLGTMSDDERRTLGPELNQLRDDLRDKLQAKKNQLEMLLLNEKLETERLDVSLPPRPEQIGHLHPLSKTMRDLFRIFGEMGFQVAEGPDIEDDFHNFNALNIPADHPARQNHDTFYFKERDGQRKLLRTHTSPVQIRTMLQGKPPFQIIAPGRTFRCDDDATHSPNFHQIEGLVIGENIHMGHLKGCLMSFFKAYFEVDQLNLRFRPSFFPFTEPSAEVDIQCERTKTNLKIGTGTDWLEILGAGMVHPQVLKNVGLDPEKYQGFAFGMGIERITMLKYGLPDLRMFFESDVRWLKHYGFVQNLLMGARA